MIQPYVKENGIWKVAQVHKNITTLDQNTYTVTIPDTNIDSDLTDFTVPLHLGTSVGTNNYDTTKIFTDLGANYLKLKCTNSTGDTEYPVEVAFWDESTQEAILWVKVPSILATGGATVKLSWDASWADNPTYVGVPGSTTAGDAWDSNHVDVYHMSTSGGSLVNSVHLYPDLTVPRGTPSAGLPALDDIGEHIRFDHDEDDGYERSSNDMYNFAVSDAVTVSVYCKPERIDYVTNFHGTFFGADNNGAGGEVYLRIEDVTNLPMFWYNAGGWRSVTGPALTRGQWHFLSGKRAVNEAGSILVDTSRTDGASFSSGLLNAGYNHSVGIMAGFLTNSTFDGVISEVIVSNNRRSDAWEKALYYGITDNLVSYELTTDGSKSSSYIVVDDIWYRDTNWLRQAPNPPAPLAIEFDPTVQDALTYAENNTRLSHTAATYRATHTKQYIPSGGVGKGYAEITINAEASTDFFCFGFITGDYTGLNSYLTHSSLGATYGYGTRCGNSNVTVQYNSSSAPTLYDGGLVTAGDTVTFAVDTNNQRFYFGNDGGGESVVWYERPNGTSHIPPDDVGIWQAVDELVFPYNLYIGCSLYGNGEDVSWNFGQSDFKHTLPTGFVAMNTIMVEGPIP